MRKIIGKPCVWCRGECFVTRGCFPWIARQMGHNGFTKEQIKRWMPLCSTCLDEVRAIFRREFGEDAMPMSWREKRIAKFRREFPDVATTPPAPRVRLAKKKPPG